MWDMSFAGSSFRTMNIGTGAGQLFFEDDKMKPTHAVTEGMAATQSVRLVK